MGITLMGAHGNALIVETPENMYAINHRGWGTDLNVKPGTETWCHIPIPTTIRLNGSQMKALKAFLLFEAPVGNGAITNVHLYDGPYVIQQFDNLQLAGTYLNDPDNPTNSFILSIPHYVHVGLGLTFLYQAYICIDPPCPDIMLRIAGGGVFMEEW